MTPGQPNLTQLLEAAIAAAGEDIRVCIPGVISSVSADLKTASVQPTVRRAGADHADPVLPAVPLLFPRCGAARITWPVASGDPCIILFGDRSLEEWESGGGSKAIEPADPRTHDITDALCIPMGRGGSGVSRSSDVSIAIDDHTAGTAELRLLADGTVALGNTLRVGGYKEFDGTNQQFSGVAELLGLVVELVDVLMWKLSDGKKLVAGTPDGNTTPCCLTEIAWNAIAPIRAKLDALKGSL